MSDFLLQQQGFTVGPVTVRLAKNQSEIEAAQHLRYRVFYNEQGAIASPDVSKLERDYDEIDSIADHLIVIDETKKHDNLGIVGTYRLIRQEIADQFGKFYTDDEFNIAPLRENGGYLLELGRSCTAKEYRTRPVLQLLWQGIAEYIAHYDIDTLFGCASFRTTSPDDLKQELSYLFHNHLAPESLRAKTLPDLYVDMNMMEANELDPKKVLQSLPPLVKGYLRAGAFVGDGAFIDHQWGSIDVCIILRTDLLSQRYKKHYDRKKDTPIPPDTDLINELPEKDIEGL